MTDARRLEASSLGYVNLLHIAVTLAGVPDPALAPAPSTPVPVAPMTPGTGQGPPGQVPQPDDVPDSPEEAQARLDEAEAAAAEEQDSSTLRCSTPRFSSRSRKRICIRNFSTASPGTCDRP